MARRSPGSIGSGPFGPGAASRYLFRIPACALALIVLVGVLSAQLLTFEPGVPVRGQLRSDDLWNITMRNQAPDIQNGYFHVEVSDSQVGPVFAANTQELQVAPGERVLTAADVLLSDVWCENGYGAFSSARTILPEGDYCFDITLVPQMISLSQNLHVRKPRPLELVWPAKNGVVSDSQPLFVWEQPVIAGYAGEIDYRLRIAEAGRGLPPPMAANGQDYAVERCPLPAASWRYPRAERLVPGKTYVWQVEARDSAGSAFGTGEATKAAAFVYRPGQAPGRSTASFDTPRPGDPVSGSVLLRVGTDLSGAELCVLEYSFGADSGAGDWQTIGSFTKTGDFFVGRWDSDPAVRREMRDYGSSCRLRATALNRQGQQAVAVAETSVEKPPRRNRRGCGCH